jgi:hypothetical protein
MRCRKTDEFTGRNVQLGLVGFGGQRLVVDGDEAGDVALIGFDDVFGGVAMVAGFAE